MTSAPAATNTKPISDGQYLLYRKDGRKLRSPGIIGIVAKAHAPRFRHPTFEAAETEAKRLLEQLPDSTFIILQEVGRVAAGVQHRDRASSAAYSTAAGVASRAPGKECSK